MKKLTLFITCILFSITCLAQQMDLTYATINPPKGMVKMSSTDVLTFTTAHFKKNETLKAFVIKNAKDVYKVDNVLVLFNCQTRTPQDPSLAKTQEFLAPLGTTTLTTVDDKQILVLLQNYEGVMVYRYFCTNKANTRMAAGLIQFEPADQAKAKGILEGLLKSVKFK
ncbi:MAG: hypothetical protein JWQ34_1824 [Mucilaginibacter sp.]|uniref:hypothetical protein n=1 Tax=Mucilaginibacter sp. TaxID=1882438 RepID=UPI002612D019|nr:hypothetical protein [Mucilaginibacter sp.]MDB5003599.1 hypothetical protein [Mucilaginibacter sp.]